MVFELTTGVGNLFQCTKTLKYDLQAIVLHLCTFDYTPLPLVTIALFIINNLSGFILLKLFRNVKTPIISLLILRLWSENKSNRFNCSSCNVGMCFVARLYTPSKLNIQ